MSDQDPTPRNSFEEALRAIAQEVNRTVDRLQELDFDEMARSVGVDPDQARGWVDEAGEWLRTQADSIDTSTFKVPDPSAFMTGDAFRASRPAGDAPAGAADPLAEAGPHPLDLPTAEQGAALAALDSRRWILEPGTSTLTVVGDGPGPSDALGLVRELRVRDWLSADGQLTLAGLAALQRWLDAA